MCYIIIKTLLEKYSMKNPEHSSFFNNRLDIYETIYK